MNGIYEWLASEPTSFFHFAHPFLAMASVKASVYAWYNKLGHLFSKLLYYLISKCYFPLSLNISFSHCNACKINKMHKLSFFTSSLSSSFPLELIYSNV